MFEVFYHTLSLVDSSNRCVSLDGTPASADNVALDVIGGTAQYLGSGGDFGVDGTLVRWDSTVYDLYNELESGDKIRVIYDQTNT
jgi:hypothetical protein